MTQTITDRAQAAAMKLELMKWETFDAFVWMHYKPSATLTQEQIDTEIESVKELSERNPEFLSRAWVYFQEQIENATSLKQVLVAWVHGECNDRVKAVELYDAAMSSRMSFAKMRKAISDANGTTPAPKAAGLAERDADRVLAKRKLYPKPDGFVSSAILLFADEIAADPDVAKALAKREAK